MGQSEKRDKMKLDISLVHGIVVPIITPLRPDETVDESALHKIIEHLLAAHVHGIFVNSTTGEGICLSDNERIKILTKVVDEISFNIPVYAGVSDTSTKRTIRNLKDAEKLGANIAVIHPPFFYPPSSQEELYNYFKEIAQDASIPVMLYNIPLTTKAPIALETIIKLLEFENIIGIKDSTGDLAFLQKLIELKYVRHDFKIFVGKSQLWGAGILSGADGGLDGISNLIPGHCVRFYQAIKANSEKVFELQREINEIWQIYECCSYLGGLKAAMHFLGLCEPITARPILPASKEEVRKIKQILLTNGILK